MGVYVREGQGSGGGGGGRLVLVHVCLLVRACVGV